jgi:pSer/pThr/pTyr-binding forkhead associated (FHA) protein
MLSAQPRACVAGVSVMAARLVPQTEGSPVISCEKAITLIGRHPDCDGVLSDSQKISRRHCCIAQVDNRLILRDLGSMNGVTVNGEQVTEIELHDGDEITIGDQEFLLEIKPKGPIIKSPPKSAKKADPDAPTPEKPSPNPRQANAATAQSSSRRGKASIDISREFPVPIPEEDEDVANENSDRSLPLSRTGHRSVPRPTLPPKKQLPTGDDSDGSANDILKLDSGEIQMNRFEGRNKKKK